VPVWIFPGLLLNLLLMCYPALPVSGFAFNALILASGATNPGILGCPHIETYKPIGDSQFFLSHWTASSSISW